MPKTRMKFLSIKIILTSASQKLNLQPKNSIIGCLTGLYKNAIKLSSLFKISKIQSLLAYQIFSVLKSLLMILILLNSYVSTLLTKNYNKYILIMFLKGKKYNLEKKAQKNMLNLLSLKIIRKLLNYWIIQLILKVYINNQINIVL